MSYIAKDAASCLTKTVGTGSAQFSCRWPRVPHWSSYGAMVYQ